MTQPNSTVLQVGLTFEKPLSDGPNNVSDIDYLTEHDNMQKSYIL